VALVTLPSGTKVRAEAVACACRASKAIVPLWNELAPKNYRWVIGELLTSKVTTIDEMTQARCLKRIQESEDCNFIITGPPGCGKTIFALKLLHQALVRPFFQLEVDAEFKESGLPRAWRISASELLNANHAFKMKTQLPQWDNELGSLLVIY
jgi:predicted NACHT family NTPase